MIKLLKNLSKKEILFIFLAALFVIFHVYLELKVPDYMSEITRLVQMEGSKVGDILKNGSFMILCAFLSLVCNIIVIYFATYVASSFSASIRKKIFTKVENMGIAEVKKFSTNSLITRITNDVTQIEMLFSMGISVAFKAPIMAIWAILKILNKGFAWSVLTGVLVFIMIFIAIILMIIVLPRFERIQKLIDKINGVTRENLSGIRVIRAFNAEKYQTDKFRDVNDELTKLQLFNQRCFAIINPAMNIILHGLSLGIYIIGAILIEKANMFDKIDLFSNMIVFTSYGVNVIMSFLMLSFIFMSLPRAAISSRRINEILEEEVSLKDGKYSSTTKNSGTVEFKNVSFKYPDGEEYVIKNITFKVSKGETLAIIGSTGSGKSTLVNLIPRFYDVNEGEVLVDGVNVKDYKIEALNNKLGYVPQKPVLFSKTVEENIKYGNNGKRKIKLDEVKEAIKIAQAEEFVTKMKDSYKSFISRGGTNISGGQKQRLSIARAVARTPEIFIFDDSFSALDYKTDSNLRKCLKKQTKDATCIIVAQRIGTIIGADKIIVLDDGKCVGMGTHKELLKSCDVYREIASCQLSKEEL